MLSGWVMTDFHSGFPSDRNRIRIFVWVVNIGYPRLASHHPATPICARTKWTSMNGIDTFMDVQTCSVSCVGTAMFLADTRKVIALQTPPPTRCTRKRCVAVALPLLLAVSGPQARAADFARPPEQTVLVDRQPPASATENTPAAPR